MIPVRLELHNFMAYRDPEPLSFDDIHLACLVGANGAGKSSLLDAITWALWGRARARRDDELFHLGVSAKDMHVIFDFDLSGQIYRVHRRRERTKRSSRGALDFFVRDGDNWRTLSESSARATQEKITRVLRLDYDTFINSSLLLQGRADEFTTKRPAERKEVLGNILGLDVWAVFEDRAKEQVRACKQELELLERQLQDIEAELSHEAEYQQGLVEAQQRALKATDDLREAEARFREIDASRQKRDAARTRLRDLEERIEQDEAELRRAEGDIARQEARLAGYREVLDDRAEIEAGYTGWQAAVQAEKDFNERFRAYAELGQQRGNLQQRLQAARSELEASLRVLAERVTDAERKISAGDDARTELETLAAEIEALAVHADRVQTLREQTTARKEERAGLQSENRQLKVEIDGLADRLARLQASDEPTCPLCGQDLTEEHRADLIGRLTGDRAGKAARQQANVERLNAIGAELAAYQQEINAAEADLRRLPELNGRRAALGEQINAAGEAQTALETLAAEQAALQGRLETGDYAPEAHAQLDEVSAQIDALGYDREAHEAAGREVARLAPFEARKAAFDAALTGQVEAEELLAQAAGRRGDWQARLAEAQAAADGARAEIASLEVDLEGAEDHEQRLRGLRLEQAQAREALGVAQQKVSVLEDKRKRRETLHTKRARLTEELAVYTDLRKACSKNGVPTMIIETAIPEIEEAANDLLRRLSDGQMHLRFETQREKVTGGAAETLDIKISDGLGTRDYEMYSGGEAFRVNFAIRIALSRLLARRAGAQLRTLIADEGFGSQDAAGRERLVEAINAIKGDFDRIIVITHIDELKDSFPVRIEVTKTDQGSQISVM